MKADSNAGSATWLANLGKAVKWGYHSVFLSGLGFTQDHEQLLVKG